MIKSIKSHHISRDPEGSASDLTTIDRKDEVIVYSEISSFMFLTEIVL